MNAKKSSKFTWKTSNKKIAKISKKVAKGKKASATVKGVKEGKAKITATYKKGSKKVKLTCKVTVNKAPVVTSQPTSTAPAAQPTRLAADRIRVLIRHRNLHRIHLRLLILQNHHLHQLMFLRTEQLRHVRLLKVLLLQLMVK